MATTDVGREPAAQARASRIPEFRSTEEEAEFWETHDRTECEDEWEEVTDVEFVRAYVPNSIVVQFDAQTVAALRERALARQIGITTLIRQWVADRLHAEETAPTVASAE